MSPGGGGGAARARERRNKETRATAAQDITGERKEGGIRRKVMIMLFLLLF
jgi:hypothetical protein